MAALVDSPGVPTKEEVFRQDRSNNDRGQTMTARHHVKNIVDDKIVWHGVMHNGVQIWMKPNRKKRNKK